MDLERLAQVARQECGLDGDTPVVVGVSGGPDSLCLLDVLQRSGWNVVVAHFNHGLRPEAGADAQRVAEFAQQRGLAFVLGGEDVAAQAQAERRSLEEAARRGRYRFLFTTARRLGAQAVAVGHTADDQVETVLMHLLRGAGLAGLKGMAYRAVLAEWDASLPLVRPLLGCWRSEVLAHCQTHGLDPLWDASNADTTFFRNRLRHELIPYLQDYNPQVKTVLWRMAQALAGDHAVLEAQVEQAWAACAPVQSSGCVLLEHAVLRGLPLGLQRGVLRRAVGLLRPALRDVDFACIERGVNFVAAAGGGRTVELVQGLRLSLEGGRVLLAEDDAAPPVGDWPQLTPGTVWTLPLPGRVALPGGWVLESETLAGNALGTLPPLAAGRYQAWLDAERLAGELTLRTFRPGDRIAALGLGGHSLKLSDLWVNERLPRRARAGWPIVCAGEEIVWVPGFRLAQPFGLSAGTRRMLHLRLERQDWPERSTGAI